MVGAVAVEDDHLLEAVVGEAFGDAEHVLDKVLVVDIDRTGKIHDVVHVAITDRRQYQGEFGFQARGLGGNGIGAEMVDFER